MLFKVTGKVQAARECPHCAGVGEQKRTLDVAFEITAEPTATAEDLTAWAEAALSLANGWEFQEWRERPVIEPLTPRAMMERAGLPDLFSQSETPNG